MSVAAGRKPARPRCRQRSELRWRQAANPDEWLRAYAKHNKHEAVCVAKDLAKIFKKLLDAPLYAGLNDPSGHDRDRKAERGPYCQLRSRELQGGNGRSDEFYGCGVQIDLRR